MVIFTCRILEGSDWQIPWRSCHCSSEADELPSSEWVSMFGLNHDAVVYLVEQLFGVQFHDYELTELEEVGNFRIGWHFLEVLIFQFPDGLKFVYFHACRLRVSILPRTTLVSRLKFKSIKITWNYHLYSGSNQISV